LFCSIRSAPWRRWLALFAVVCAVSLYSIEATHFHHTLAEQLNCPAGHAVGHSPVNVFTPEFTATFDAPSPCVRESLHFTAAFVGNAPYFIPHSHAPPSLVS
jgi:hypothetical protein